MKCARCGADCIEVAGRDFESHNYYKCQNPDCGKKWKIPRRSD